MPFPAIGSRSQFEQLFDREAFVDADSFVFGPTERRFDVNIAAFFELAGRVQDRAAPADTLRAGVPQQVTIEVDGVLREFGIILPEGFDPAQTYPAIMTFHGAGYFTDRPGAMATLVDYDTDGGPAPFIQVYPQGLNGDWAWEPTNSGADDVAFVTALADALVADWSVDGAKLFAAGMSAGGLMVQRLAFELPDLFAAHAVVAAPMLGSLAAVGSPPDADAPMIMFQGDADPFFPEAGVTGWRGTPVIYGIEETADFWAARNDSTMGDPVALPDPVDDGKTVTLRSADDGSVAQYIIAGGGHYWPGSLQRGATDDIDASALIVDFFADYGL